MINKIAPIVFVLACAISVNAQNYTIKGKIDGLGNEKIIIPIQGEELLVDAKNGVFKVKSEIKEEPYVTLFNTSYDRNTYIDKEKNIYMPSLPLDVVISKGAKIKIEGDIENFHFAKVTGDPLNEGFTKFRESLRTPINELMALQKQFMEIRSRNEREGLVELRDKMMANKTVTDSIKKHFIKNNPETFASLYFLTKSFNIYTPKELEETYNSLSSNFKETSYAKTIESKIKADKLISDGGPMPDFTKLDVNGNKVSLSQFKGKYVLIDFWGSWCKPCRASNPHLKELYEKYKPSGFEILGVASETKGNQELAEKNWKEAISQDGLTWTNVINNEDNMVQDVIQMYNIRAFPTQILLDKEGKLIGRWAGAGRREVDEQLKAIFEK